MSDRSSSGPPAGGQPDAGRGLSQGAPSALAAAGRCRKLLEARELGLVADAFEDLARLLEAHAASSQARPALERALAVAEELQQDAPCKNRILRILSRLSVEARPIAGAGEHVEELAEAVLKLLT